MSFVNDNLSRLIDEARAASRRAHCPYSEFPVGAAVLASDGRIFSGCNVENASYGLTLCAERNAIVRMIRDGATELAALVIYTSTNHPTAPCGACRQVANEFGPRTRVVCVCDGDERIDTSLANLLPHAFGPNNLKG